MLWPSMICVPMRPLNAMRVVLGPSTVPFGSFAFALPPQSWTPGPAKNWSLSLSLAKRSPPTRNCQELAVCWRSVVMVGSAVALFLKEPAPPGEVIADPVCGEDQDCARKPPPGAGDRNG